jgi:hypothetical protein
MNGTTLKADKPITSLPDPGWRIVGVGDSDGDGASREARAAFAIKSEPHAYVKDTKLHPPARRTAK